MRRGRAGEARTSNSTVRIRPMTLALVELAAGLYRRAEEQKSKIASEPALSDCFLAGEGKLTLAWPAASLAWRPREISPRVGSHLLPPVRDQSPSARFVRVSDKRGRSGVMGVQSQYE